MGLCILEGMVGFTLASMTIATFKWYLREPDYPLR